MSERALDLAARVGQLAERALELTGLLRVMAVDAPAAAREIGGRIIAAAAEAVAGPMAQEVADAEREVIEAAKAWGAAELHEESATDDALLAALDRLRDAEQAR